MARNHGRKVGYEKHGQSYTRLYRIWSDMKRRCSKYAPNNSRDEKARYYDQGIRVCKEWRLSFSSFRSWALSNGYNNSLTIDRKDPKLGYNPTNCRWVSRTHQLTNARKRKTKTHSKYKGVTWNKQRQKWMAYINVNKKMTYLGLFIKEVDAAIAYDVAAEEIYGEFARTNF